MRARLPLAIGLVALAGVVAAVALTRRDRPAPAPVTTATESAAPAPAPPSAAATAAPTPATASPPAPIHRPPLPPGAPRGTHNTTHSFGQRPAGGLAAERLQAAQGRAPFADARAATNPRDKLAVYDRYLAANPAGPLREQAMVGRAGALEALGDKPQAVQAWRDVLQSFPGTMHGPQARRRIIDLQR
jgi:hypothetical protein